MSQLAARVPSSKGAVTNFVPRRASVEKSHWESENITEDLSCRLDRKSNRISSQSLLFFCWKPRTRKVYDSRNSNRLRSKLIAWQLWKNIGTLRILQNRIQPGCCVLGVNQLKLRIRVSFSLLCSKRTWATEFCCYTIQSSFICTIIVPQVCCNTSKHVPAVG